MEKEKRRLSRDAQLFLSVFRLSACTFGGGFVIVPLMKKRFADELGWIDEKEMMDITAIAESSPGAIAVNAAILVGYHESGVRGALIAVAGTVLPPLIILSAVSFFYQAFRSNPEVGSVMAGILCGAAAVIADVVIDMIRPIIAERNLIALAMIAASFIAVRVFSVNAVAVLLACGLIGLILSFRKSKAGDLQ